jgi:hypothetical protein
MTEQVIERATLGALTNIGRGEHAVIYGAPNAMTKFVASMAYKEYTAQALADIDFTALAAMPALVQESLSDAEAERLTSIAAWPYALVEDGGAATGFVMPAIPDKFFMSLPAVTGTPTSAAEFHYLLIHSEEMAAHGIELDEIQRYSLLREVASALAFLHSHGVCAGDISPKNLLFSLTPHEAVYFVHCDTMRINGASPLPPTQTPGWESPVGEESATIYSDAYKLGLLVLRLVAGDYGTTDVAQIPSSTPDLLRQTITDTLTNAPHQRPLPEAWTHVLGDAIEQAQHRRKTAAPTQAPVCAPPAAPAVPIVHSRPQVVPSARPVSESALPISETAPPVPPSTSSAKMWAGVILATVVIAAVLVIAVALTKHGHRAPAVAPATSSAAPSSSSSQPTPAPPPPAASAGASELAPFAREWDGMRESVVINPTGRGHFHYRMPCASCSMADMPYNTLDFALTSVSNGTANGSVTASSDPQIPVGTPVAATLASQDTIQWAIGGKNVGLFCGSNPAYCGY